MYPRSLSVPGGSHLTVFSPWHLWVPPTPAARCSSIALVTCFAALSQALRIVSSMQISLTMMSYSLSSVCMLPTGIQPGTTSSSSLQSMLTQVPPPSSVGISMLSLTEPGIAAALLPPLRLEILPAPSFLCSGSAAWWMFGATFILVPPHLLG